MVGSTGLQDQQHYFRGGASINHDDYLATLILHPSQGVTIVGEIVVEPAHVGQLADLLIVAGVTFPDSASETIWRLTPPGTAIPWDGDRKTLVAAQTKQRLVTTQPLTLYSGLLPQSQLRIWFGYRLLESNFIIFNGQQPIEVQITDYDKATTLKSAVIWQADFNPTGTQMVAASSEGLASLWDLQTGKHLVTTSGFQS